MTTRWRALWESRSPRERRLLVVAAAVTVVVLYGAFVLSAERARGPLRADVESLRGQALQLEAQARDYAALQRAPARSASATPLRTLVQDSLEASGLARGVARLEAPDSEHVVVVLGAVGFADWLRWVATLREQHVRLESCRIEALAAPGMVGVSATLARPGQR